MKKKRYLCLVLSALMLTGCQPAPDTGSSQTEAEQSKQESAGELSSSDKTDSESTPDDSSEKPQLPSRDKVPNEIVYYTAAEAKDIIQSSTHFTVAEDFWCSVPESISHFSSFTLGYYPRQDNAGLYEDFLTMFAALFPDEKLHQDCLFYIGKDSGISYDENNERIDTVKTVSEQYDRVMNGEEDVQYYFYSPHFRTEQVSDAENNIFMGFSGPIGSGLSNFNKGVLADYYYESFGKENNVFLEARLAESFYSAVRTLPPDSEEAYPLLDGVSISVADAVTFFEEYINNLPLPANPTLDIKVVQVDVLQCDDNAYCYFFSTTKAMDDIPFDWFGQGSTIGGDAYSYVLGYGSMAVSDDVDQIYGMQRAQVVYDEVMHTEGISFETAMQKMEENLSAQINFEVISAEFVYCSKAVEDYSVAPEYYFQPTTASWKVSLYNPNDDFVYVCYVDALDGGDFHYYKREK